MPPTDEQLDIARELADAAALARAILDKADHVRTGIADNPGGTAVLNTATRIGELAELIEQLADDASDAILDA